MINIAILGYGYWGPNLARNFSGLDDCRITTIVDSSPDRLKLIQRSYPQAKASSSPGDALNDPNIDGVAIALPVSMHYEFAKQALQQNKHVLIEKPMTNSKSQALELVNLATQRKKTVMVDHTFLYTGAIKKIKEIITNNEIGNIQYFDSTRINLGLFQHDINVVWDLAPHDISILEYLIEEEPVSLVATGISHTGNQIENIAYFTLYYEKNLIAHFNVSWTSPVKIRKILIGGDKKMIVYDDIEPTEKVKVYDTGYQFRESENVLVDYRTGDISIPKLDQTEALHYVAKDFIHSITTGKEPVSNWKIGLAVVGILEAAEQSIKNRGREVILK